MKARKCFYNWIFCLNLFHIFSNINILGWIYFCRTPYIIRHVIFQLFAEIPVFLKKTFQFFVVEIRVKVMLKLVGWDIDGGKGSDMVDLFAIEYFPCFEKCISQKSMGWKKIMVSSMISTPHSKVPPLLMTNIMCPRSPLLHFSRTELHIPL